MSNNADVQFLRLGVQYYVAGRSAVLAALLPISGNLFHHAIESFLKARLSQKLSLQKVKALGGRTGHELPPLWDAFKTEFPMARLEEFDGTIADLEHFERLRYPDAVIKEGAEILVGTGTFIGTPGANPAPRYQIDTLVIDHLVAKIFEVCSRNPAFFTGGMNSYAREAITRNNPIGERFLPKGKKAGQLEGTEDHPPVSEKERYAKAWRYLRRWEMVTFAMFVPFWLWLAWGMLHPPVNIGTTAIVLVGVWMFFVLAISLQVRLRCPRCGGMFLRMGLLPEFSIRRKCWNCGLVRGSSPLSSGSRNRD